jgi:hypothetical protein
VPKGPSISGNLCPKLDIQDFEKEEGQFTLPALLVVTTLSCGSLDDVDEARMAKQTNQEPQFIEPPVSVALTQGQKHSPHRAFFFLQECPPWACLDTNFREL